METGIISLLFLASTTCSNLWSYLLSRLKKIMAASLQGSWQPLTGLGFDSVKSSLSRWQRWHNHYLNRKGRKKQYRYSLANYGIEFLKILHLIAPDKEQEFLTIIAANRQRIERERIVMPNDEKISSAGEITRDEQAMKTRDFIKKYLPNWRDTREDGRRDV